MAKAVEQLRLLADELEEDASRLNQEIPPVAETRRRRKRTGKRLKMIRRGTVCGRYRGTETRVADLRLCGLWLKAAGFDIGQKYEVEVEDGNLTIRPVERQPERRNTVTGKEQRTERQPGVKTRAEESPSTVAGDGVSGRD